MIVTLRVRTIKGYAKSTAWKIKPFLITSWRKVKSTTYCNEADDEILWTLEGDLKYIMKIQRNAAMFERVMKDIFSNKQVKKELAKFPLDQQKDLQDMLNNHTSIDIIKNATLQELDENNTTLMERIKKKWKEFTLKP